MPPSLKPTVKQQQVLDYLLKFKQMHGYMPSYRQIGTDLEIKAGTVRNHLLALEARGLITWTPNESRSLVVVNG